MKKPLFLRFAVLGSVGLAAFVAGCDSSSGPRPLVLPASTNHQETATAEESTWPNFRGPDFTATTSAALPLQWDVDEGLLWQTELPGRGASSPIVTADRIYLTAYDGYGLTVEAAGEQADLRHHLLCFDRETGKPLWQREITGTPIDQPMNPELARHGFASSTPATDGENVYAFFGVTGVFAFDVSGNLLWQRNVGLEKHYFGSSASLLLHGDILIVNASIESRAIYGLDKLTGAATWWIENIDECWSMPVIGKNADGQPEMIVSSKNTVAGYDPATGERLWHCAGIHDYVVSVPVVVDGICYLTGGKEKQMMAIRLGGRGDVESTHKLWETKRIGSNVSSPVFRDGRLFVFHDTGILQVIDAANGDLIKRQRSATRSQPFSSPLLAGECLYMPMQDAGIAVHMADAECEQVALNATSDGLPLMASIAPGDRQFWFRSDRYLACVGSHRTTTVTNAWTTPADHQTVTAREPYNIEAEKGWSRRYLLFLSDNFDETIRFLLMPYLSVITNEQTGQSRDIMLEHKDRYDELCRQFVELNEESLKAPANELAAFDSHYRDLETATETLNNDMRIRVKELFSEEQMQQHLDDAKKGIAHLPPDQ